MLGWKLFLRAATLILDNLGVALRISLVPYGIVAIASLWLTLSWPDVVGSRVFDSENPPPADFVTAVLIAGFFSGLGYLWIAVAWHRYVLVGEEPQGWIPPLQGGRLLGYLGRSILVVFVALLVSLAATTIASILLLPLFGNAVMPIVQTLALFVVMIFFYRIGLILPAGTIDKPMRLNEALIATKGQSGPIVTLALLTVGLSLLLEVPAMLDGAEASRLISVVYQLVIGWFGLLLGVGSLTALYGHMVEGRALD